MKARSLRQCPQVLLSGRFDAAQEGFELFWSGAQAEIWVTGSRFEVEIEVAYDLRRPYLSIEVDGLCAQTFSPLEGRHWYTAFLGMEPARTHKVRIIKETMPFFDGSKAVLTRIRGDGELMPVPPKKRKIEFIGDSITAGEGGRGPVGFDEWLPMIFSSRDNYTRLTADALNAQYNVVAISGAGVISAWNNEIRTIPAIYERLYGTLDARPYDFSFQPDSVVIALGTNDNNAIQQPPFTDPASGRVYKLTDSPEDMERLTQGAHDFIKCVAARNPGARIVWMSFYTSGPVHDALNEAVRRSALDGVKAEFFVPVDLYRLPRGGMGSRYHPGKVTHRAIAKKLSELLK